MPSKIKKRGKVRWLACVKRQGRRQQKLFDSKSEARAWEERVRAELNRSNQAAIATGSLIEWAEAYLDYVSPPRFALSTYSEKRDVFRRFLRLVPPETLVTQFRSKEALNYLEFQARQRSGNAANKDRKNLSTAWTWGTEFHQFPPNPFLRVDRFKEKREPRYVPPKGDLDKVLELTEGQDRVMLLTFLYTAARRGEVFRLKWEDLDFVRKRIRFWTQKRAGGDVEPDWLPMINELKRELLWWRDKHPIEHSPFVFACLDETPFCEPYFGKPFKVRLHFMRRLCDKAGVKRFGYHSIRHLSASTLYESGQSLGVIQQILRHKSPRTTERYIRSLGLEETREALESLATPVAKVIPINKKSAHRGGTVAGKSTSPEYFRGSKHGDGAM